MNYVLSAMVLAVIAWSVWLYRKGAAGAVARDDLKEMKHAEKAREQFREGLKEQRRLVRDWFDRRRDGMR